MDTFCCGTNSPIHKKKKGNNDFDSNGHVNFGDGHLF